MPVERRIVPIIVTAALVALIARPGPAAPSAAEYFESTCSACHAIGATDGEERLGPDLAGVLDRRSRDWVVRFILDPEAVVASGDPTALKLVEAADGQVMPTDPDMTPALAEALADFLAGGAGAAAEGGNGTTDAAALAFREEDVAEGRAIFTGARALESGGPACLGCHGAGKLPALGGGRLGPDLTRVFDRFKGVRGTSAWLSSPATPLMRTIFRKHPLSEGEVRALTAFFQHTVKSEAPVAATGSAFLLLGLGVAAVAMIAMEAFWRRRLRGVRKPLVDSVRVSR